MFRVGLCWFGTKEHGNDKDRSCPFSFMPYFENLPEIEAVSLQYGEPTNFPDYLATAKVVQSLGAVVTVDTSVVHVAGTLGVPTLVLAPTTPDWRWPRKFGARTPWYSSVRVIRRDSSKNWQPAIEEAVRIVQAMSNGADLHGA